MTEMMTYRRIECATFRKTDERFGGLSNMAPAYPVFVSGTRVLTTEHLYQCCRFPNHPEIQKEILKEKSPMSAKMKSKPHRKEHARLDWEGTDGQGVQVEVMRWCLHLKLSQNWARFRTLLLETGDRPIVEESHNDRFWGAVESKDSSSILVGQNVLGSLLMDLRDRVRTEPEESLRRVQPPNIPSFNFLGRPVVAKT